MERLTLSELPRALKCERAGCDAPAPRRLCSQRCANMVTAQRRKISTGRHCAACGTFFEPRPTQVAAATPQSLPDLTTIAPPEPTPAAAPATQILAATAPTVAAAASDAPRSGHVVSSALIAKETSTPATPTVAAETAPSTKPEANTGLPVFPAHTPYANARLGLLALGYGPASLPDAGKCDSNTDATCFPERASCSKAEGIQCDFLWRRGEQLIKVRTVAVPPTISSVECQVNCK